MGEIAHYCEKHERFEPCPHCGAEVSGAPLCGKRGGCDLPAGHEGFHSPNGTQCRYCGTWQRNCWTTGEDPKKRYCGRTGRVVREDITHG